MFMQFKNWLKTRFDKPEAAFRPNPNTAGLCGAGSVVHAGHSQDSFEPNSEVLSQPPVEFVLMETTRSPMFLKNG